MKGHTNGVAVLLYIFFCLISMICLWEMQHDQCAGLWVERSGF